MTDIPQTGRPFDITADLPHGTTLLQASAGTGKTWAIAAVVARAVASGQVSMDRVLLVTFNRSAARQLRSRVHARLVSAHRLLTGGRDAADELDTVLASRPDGERAQMADRLRAGLDAFEDATITTTHEFASRMLDELGVLADHDRSSRLLADAGPLTDQVAADLYLRANLDQDRPPSPAPSLRLARQVAVQYREVEIAEPSGTPRSLDRTRWARAVRAEVDRRSRAQGWHTFDDLIADLAHALADPDRGPAAVRTLSTRFCLVMVDEFQDTDPLQWAALDLAFRGRVDLWLIGDPKQSIYAFRGADIHSYLEATERVDRVLALRVNRRADQPVVAGISHLFGPALLGDSRIRLEPVEAWHTGSRLGCRATDGHRYSWERPVQLRCIRSEGGSMDGATADRRIAEDLANQVVMMLEGGSTWTDDDGRVRPLSAPDIAVLVRTRRRGSQIRAALASVGQPAVFSGDESVWSSAATADLIDLLDALSRPEPAVMARLALSPLGGGRPEEMVRPDSRVRPDLAVSIGSWARRWDQLGPWGLVDEAVRRPGVMPSMLSDPRGERYLTDLRQAAQLSATESRDRADGSLGAGEGSGRPGPAELAGWLRDQRDSASVESPRRLETDRRAVTIMTIHQAKGLGFPVVLLPDAARSWPMRDRDEPLVWHDGARRVLDLGGQGPRREQAWESHLADQRAEDLRTLYVGLTRARSALRLWWAPDRRQHRGSPLHRLLAFDHLSVQTPGPGQQDVDPARLSWLDPSLIEVVQVPRQMLLTRHDRAAESAVAAPRSLDRRIDRSWGRTSYSGLTDGLHTFGVDPRASGADRPAGTDEPQEAETSTQTTEAIGGQDPGSGLCAMPGGTAFGTLVHAILERVRPVGEGLSADVADQTSAALAQTPLPGVSPEDLAGGLVDVMRTPLGELTSGLRLCDIGEGNRLAELGFELAMAPDSRHASVLADIAAALNDPGLVSPEDPLADYGRVLADSPASDRVLAGFLTGSLDAVLRLPDQRHVVVDYKTNRVPLPPGESLEPRHYGHATMTQMMIDSHYPLQAILYSAALHRFLAARLPGYDPARHLGGVGYLFVRGMTGDTPAPAAPVLGGSVQGSSTSGSSLQGDSARDTPTGVFSWYPRPELVVRVSELLWRSSPDRTDSPSAAQEGRHD
ncbi:exodeoxyribonuclease V subunit beta [Acidipropionibacterium jensenii]|uniref:RecBCD enzyme subunit RecB n=1 Tax=Acidipropionibacterium jensenii TaxID=1749 RepID=A0A3Q9ULJ0_9ACTN|nr:UvrD-helicase domain-containing protein [Acidipropionibacterium jensenii]AZZ40725.1 exodeoxyribonuclease V subunit beta [Acidipropionibacterium jensenii]